MTAWLLSNLSTLLFGLGGIIVALFTAWAKGRTSGAKAERDKQAAAEQRATDIADEIFDDVHALPPSTVREQLSQRTKP